MEHSHEVPLGEFAYGNVLTKNGQREVITMITQEWQRESRLNVVNCALTYCDIRY